MFKSCFFIGIVIMACHNKTEHTQVQAVSIMQPQDSGLKHNAEKEEADATPNSEQTQIKVDSEAPVLINSIPELQLTLETKVDTSVQSVNENRVYYVNEVDEKPKFFHKDECFIDFLSDNISFCNEGSYKDEIEVEYTVSKDGSVSDIRVINSTGYRCHKEDCIRVIRLTDKKWQPAVKNGVPVDCRMKKTIVYESEDTY